MGVIWLAAIIVFAILEAVTYQIVSIWFVFGAVGGMIAYILGADFYWQMGIFIAVSAILLAILRPLSMKLVKKQDFKTNADSLIGKNILITQEVSNIKGTGQGKINGMVWTVRGGSDEVIHTGEIAKVKRIEGVKLIAEKIG
jgi:membrane protein implicated in regulation of membrane protease activity